MDKLKRSLKSRKEKTTDDSNSSNPSLAIRSQNAKRIRSQGSNLSLSSTSGVSRAASVRVSKKSRVSSGSSQHLQVPSNERLARESSADSGVSAAGSTAPQTSVILEPDPEDNARRPEWTVRHRIFLDNDLISCTTSMARVGYHKFADFLLREQIETRLYHAHNGRDAHFAERHAVLRFWQADGSLAEKWMDRDWDGEKEHEFAMENTNDWTILHLSMGIEEPIEDPTESEGGDGKEEEGDREEEMHDSSSEAIEDGDADLDNDAEVLDEEEVDEPEPSATMDITSHYLSDYDEARNIAAAPATETESTSGAQRGYHWVEERRRNLEHQLREWFHCTDATCFNKGGTCIALGQNQHLHVELKDLTDWSQMIAHANRSIAATTLHLAAKLVDDQTRAQDERLADVGRERDDEDDLGEALRLQPVLASLRPSQEAKADLEQLE